MDKWGVFTIPSEESQVIAKFAEYGITLKAYTTSEHSYTISFSDGLSLGQPVVIPYNKICIVNDKKHFICCKVWQDYLPLNSRDACSERFFNWIIAPKTDDNLFVSTITSDGSSDGYLSDWCNIPDGITELDPGSNDLLLYPIIFKSDRNGNNTNSGIVFFKDLYINYQRQFKAGDIIKTSNGDEYASLGGWVLVKMN